MKPKSLYIFFLIVLTSLSDTASQLLFKSSINSLNFTVDGIKKIFRFVFRLLLTPKIWIGFGFSLMSLFLWLFVLSKADLNFAFSLDSVHYLFIGFASKFILKEHVGVKRWLGTILIVVGIFLVTLSG